jgi:uncharacterized protein YcbX
MTIPQTTTGTTTAAATVAGLWRYPVKSMAGETLPAATLTTEGILGDRAWALRDEARGGIADARTLPALLNMTVRYPDEPTEDVPGPPVHITAPAAGADAVVVASTDPNAHRTLSALLGREVTLWPRLPATDTAHYRRTPPDDGDWDRYLREFFDVPTVADAPDLSALPPEVAEYQTIPGTYFDAFPLHLITDRTLGALAELASTTAPDVRRFRPNLLLTVPEHLPGPFPEYHWIGRRLRIGTAIVHVTTSTPRCVMISHPVADLPRDRHLLRTVHTRADHNVGVYARIEQGGAIRPGDTVTLLP